LNGCLIPYHFEIYVTSIKSHNPPLSGRYVEGYGYNGIQNVFFNLGLVEWLFRVFTLLLDYLIIGDKLIIQLPYSSPTTTILLIDRSNDIL
jgi:hypothetical protein